MPLLTRLNFMLFNACMILPLILAVTAGILLLFSGSWRRALMDRWSLVTFAAIALLWSLLIAWAAVFFNALNTPSPAGPGWVIWPPYVVFYTWPVAALVFLFRAKGARWPATAWVVGNAPGWLLGCFTCAMAITGEWI